MANKDPSDVIIIIRRAQNGTEVATSGNLTVAGYTGIIGLVPTPVSAPLTGTYTAMESIL